MAFLSERELRLWTKGGAVKSTTNLPKIALVAGFRPPPNRLDIASAKL